MEIGESIEVIIDGQRVEAFLSDQVFIIDPHSVHGRMAIRGYAYSIAAGGDATAAKALLSKVGREG